MPAGTTPRASAASVAPQPRVTTSVTEPGISVLPKACSTVMPASSPAVGASSPVEPASPPSSEQAVRARASAAAAPRTRVRCRDTGSPSVVGQVGGGRAVEAADGHDHRGPAHRVGDDAGAQPERLGDEVLGEDGARVADRPDRAVAHDDEVVGVAGGEVEVVEDHDDGAAAVTVERE